MGSIAAAPLAVVRLAILECDTPRPIARSRYGSYGGMFERILRTDEQSLLLSDEHAGTIQVSKWQIDCDEAEYPDLDAIDALLMTGSSECPRVRLCLGLIETSLALTGHSDRILCLPEHPLDQPTDHLHPASPGYRARQDHWHLLRSPDSRHGTARTCRPEPSRLASCGPSS